MQSLALTLALLAGTAFPSTTQTSWMEPAAFRLEVGMPRAEVERRLGEANLDTSPGKYPRQLVVRYADNKTLTLVFVEERLQSLRFELVDFIPGVRKAHVERAQALEEALGEGTEMTGGILLFDEQMPNVMVVVSTRPDDSFGRQGLGFLSVRYYDPSAEKVLP